LKKFLIIQTAFIGDVILSTSVAEKLHAFFPDAQIDFLVRKGNESLLENHSFINHVITWDKKKNKLRNLLNIIKAVRQNHYDYIFNLHRFASSGLITALSGAKVKAGFSKNPFSFLFTEKFPHEIGNGKHEIERNHQLIQKITDASPAKPRLYPQEKNYSAVQSIIQSSPENKPVTSWYCIAPASVWFTKQFPKEKWISLIEQLPGSSLVFLLGSRTDFDLCEAIRAQVKTGNKTVINLAGKLSFLDSAALMQKAAMNFVNDSAPLHIASAMNAPVTAVFCSTIPAFGFGPLSDQSKIVETKINLDCRPCGLHGFSVCPKGHFKCALTIEIKDLLS